LRAIAGTGSVQERVANLVELRKAEGYMTEWYPVDSSDSDTDTGYRFILTEHNCAISNVAESFPSVCGHELQMFATVYRIVQWSAPTDNQWRTPVRLFGSSAGGEGSWVKIKSVGIEDTLR